MQRRSFRIPAIWAITVCGLVFLSVTMLTPGAQKKATLLGGAHGVVHLANGSPEEGVGVQLISAKTAIRTTVYSNEDGKFEFPVLEAGQYTLRIPSPREFKPFVKESVQISGATQLDDIVVERMSETEFVPPTPETVSQLTGAEWMMNIPGTGEQKAVFKLDCGFGCHSYQQIMRNRYDERSWHLILERMIQGNLKKISLSMALFQEWTREKGLRPSETAYVRKTRAGTVDLQFSKSGDPDIEKRYRTHFVSPALSERKKQRLSERLSRAAEPVVFQILRDSQCSECGAELEQGSLLLMEAEQPLCLACARLQDLEFLPAGDAALTRRATKYSGRSAVVVRFSRSRGRYERQGILIEIAALEKAEQECTADADERAAARALGIVRRREQDRELVARMTKQIRILFPGCPPDEAAHIAAHTAVRGSGRIGRTAAGQALEEQALSFAVAAAVRHRHTDYDELLATGLDRASARQQVADQVQQILKEWRK